MSTFSPFEAETPLAFGRAMEAANLRAFTAKKLTDIFVVSQNDV